MIINQGVIFGIYVFFFLELHDKITVFPGVRALGSELLYEVPQFRPRTSGNVQQIPNAHRKIFLILVMTTR